VALVIHAGDALAGLEVTVFIENVVGWEEAFVSASQEGPVREKSGGVVKGLAHGAFVWSRNTTDHGNALAGLLDKGPVAQAVLDESGLVQQVPGRISHKSQLGKDDQVTILSLGPSDGLNNSVRVALEVSNEGVDLCQCHSHLFVLVPVMSS
jgi:hypothetical protein